MAKTNTSKTLTITITITITLILIILTIIPLLKFSYYHSPSSSFLVSPPSTQDHEFITTNNNHHDCNIFSGEWVPNPDAPYYNNTTCLAISEHQNCQKYGRPDSEYMKWKWKPEGCDLLEFNPYEFLGIMRDKSLAFVGDSVGRNHMESLICMLSRVEYPIDTSVTDDKMFKCWYYISYNFTISIFWSPFLVKAKEADSKNPTNLVVFNIYLDEFDEKWTTQIDEFNYLIINAGHWFWRPTFYHLHHQLIGCRFCQQENITDYPLSFGYKKAFQTALKAINSRKNFKGITILRTFAPAHFEGGDWNKWGDCMRKSPFRSNEISLKGDNLEMYMTQMKEFKGAMRKGRKNGLRFRILDTTQAMLLRPDGHPSRYGHSPNDNVTSYNDCVHWCLPGPIDTWSDFLLQMLKMESRI